jgi:TatD DNase family protein
LIRAVDSHCHLQTTALRPTAALLVDEARKAGVVEILVAGIVPSEIDSTLKLVDSLGLWCSAGCHPCHADEWDADSVRQVLSHPRVVAVGECGLDYYHKPYDAVLQARVFREQIRMAIDVDLPLILHNRDSDADLVSILREEGARRGVFHCFGADRATLDAAVDLGFHISFAGNVTYPKATFRELVIHVPMDRLLVETDAPWLAPVPYRGKTNKPALVMDTLVEVAKLRGMDPIALGERIVDNFRVCFPKTTSSLRNDA